VRVERVAVKQRAVSRRIRSASSLTDRGLSQSAAAG
jgi:hypothetical protein